jgi:hypothetical protein
LFKEQGSEPQKPWILGNKDGKILKMNFTTALCDKMIVTAMTTMIVALRL